MQGKILDYDNQNSKGIILGDNDLRYEFINTEFKSDQSIKIHQRVDFREVDDMAVEVYAQQSTSFEKSKVVAALLAFFLGAFGFHKFYLGCTIAGITMLMVFILGFILLGIPSVIIGLIAFIESIIYIVKSDEDFEVRYVSSKKCWF